MCQQKIIAIILIALLGFTVATSFADNNVQDQLHKFDITKTNVLDNVGSLIYNTVIDTVNNTLNNLNNLVTDLRQFINNKAVVPFQDLLHKVSEKAIDDLNLIRDEFNKTSNDLLEFLNQTVINLKDQVDETTLGILTDFHNELHRIRTKLLDFFDTVTDAVRDELDKVNETAIAILNMILDTELSNFIKDSLNLLIKMSDSGFEKAKDAVTVNSKAYEQCLSSTLNFTEIQEDIDKTSLTGDIDVFFFKYCNTPNEAYKCLKAYLTAIDSTMKSRVALDSIEDTFLRYICDIDIFQITRCLRDITALRNLQECLIPVFNFTTTQEDNVMTSLQGELGTSVGEYCNKSTEVFKCFNNFFAEWNPCLGSFESNVGVDFLGIIQNIFNFICENLIALT